MQWKQLLAVLLLLSAFSTAWAQGDERPTFSIPDPERKPLTKAAGPTGPVFVLTQIKYDLADPNKDSFRAALGELQRYYRKATELETPVRINEASLSDSKIMQASMLYMTGDEAVLHLSDKEKTNLATYLKSGGFLFAEDIRLSAPDSGLNNQGAGVAGTPFDRQFKALIQDQLVLGAAGTKWRKVETKHPLYRAYFNFVDGPPMGGAPGGNVFAPESLEWRGRSVVVFSDLNISWYWGDPFADARDRGLQFGVNLIVFAMAQNAVSGMPAPTRK